MTIRFEQGKRGVVVAYRVYQNNTSLALPTVSGISRSSTDTASRSRDKLRICHTWLPKRNANWKGSVLFALCWAFSISRETAATDSIISTNTPEMLESYLFDVSFCRRKPSYPGSLTNLHRYRKTVHGHDGSSRIVMVRKTDQRTFAFAKNGEVSKNAFFTPTLIQNIPNIFVKPITMLHFNLNYIVAYHQCLDNNLPLI